MIYDTNIDLVNVNVYTKCGLNRSIRFQNIEQNLNSDDDPRGVANLDPRGMIGRIYVEYHLRLPHTKYMSFRPSGLEKKIFKCFSHYKPMSDNDPPRAWPIWTPGSRLVGIIKWLIQHCFTQNIKALGLMVSEKKIFLKCFPIISLWRPMTPPPRGVANLDPRGMIGRIYEGHH